MSKQSFTQRLILRFVSKATAQSMEEHSRRWIMTCNCGHARSIWDLGGIRYKAKGQSRNYGYCPACKKRSWHTLVWTPDGETSPGVRPSA